MVKVECEFGLETTTSFPAGPTCFRNSRNDLKCIFQLVRKNSALDPSRLPQKAITVKIVPNQITNFNASTAKVLGHVF